MSGEAPQTVARNVRETIADGRDPALTDERRALVPAGSAEFLARQNARLQVALAAQAAELAEVRRRLISAADRERARIERDLHDGAQQRLVGLMIELSRLGESADVPESVARGLTRACDELEATIDEIRKLAHGIYPDELRQFGLQAALGALARQMPFEVHLRDCGARRFNAGAEAAVYFCCLEALQNVAKHGGAGVRVDICLRSNTEGGLEFEVVDDGVGFEPTLVAVARGITGMRDRLAAIGGEVKISSAPGTGTRVSGRLPTAALGDAGCARRHSLWIDSDGHHAVPLHRDDQTPARRHRFVRL
jgi:signal transduction histidine kinase